MHARNIDVHLLLKYLLYMNVGTQLTSLCFCEFRNKSNAYGWKLSNTE